LAYHRAKQWYRKRCPRRESDGIGVWNKIQEGEVDLALRLVAEEVHPRIWVRVHVLVSVTSEKRAKSGEGGGKKGSTIDFYGSFEVVIRI
jgi:hypothetical protein